MTKPNWKTVTTYRCGCEIREVRLPTELHYTMHWCATHDAAPNMYRVLRELYELADDEISAAVWFRVKDIIDKVEEQKGSKETINPDKSPKSPKKIGVKTPSDYLGHGNPKTTPKKPSKNDGRGEL